MSVRSLTSATASDAIDCVLQRGAAGSVSVLVDQVQRRKTREKALSSMSREIDGDFLITVPGDDLGNRAFAELRVEDPLTDVVGRHDGIDPDWCGDWRREGSRRRSGSI